MKTLCLVFIAFLVLQVNVSSAQDSTKTNLKPVAGDKVMTIGIINNSAFWAYKKYKTESFAYRFGIQGTLDFETPQSSTKITTYSQFPDSISTQTEKNSSQSFGIGLWGGFQKAFGNYKRLEPYIGMDLSLFYRYSNFKVERTNDARNSYERKLNQSGKSPLELSLNALPFIGFNYYITPGLAIGAEYRLSIARIQYDAYNETSSNTIYREWINSNLIETTSEEKQDKGNFSFNSSFTGTGFITLTFFLK